MKLLDHASIAVRDLGAAKPFHVAVMTALGAAIAYEHEDAIGFGERNRADDDAHSCLSVFASPRAFADPRRHGCFRAQSIGQVQAFHAAGLAAGGSDDGAPGPRSYHPHYCAAFLLDPEGNRIEAVFHRAGAWAPRLPTRRDPGRSIW